LRFIIENLLSVANAEATCRAFAVQLLNFGSYAYSFYAVVPPNCSAFWEVSYIHVHVHIETLTDYTICTC